MSMLCYFYRIIKFEGTDIEMFYVSDIMETAPENYKSPLQEKVYETLNKLEILFERVDTDEAISMEDCIEINIKLDMKMVKTLFLCNSKKEKFYLFITTAVKPFNSKDFSNALNISRVSFAPPELLENILGVKIGAATVFGILLDKENLVQVVLVRMFFWKSGMDVAMELPPGI